MKRRPNTNLNRLKDKVFSMILFVYFSFSSCSFQLEDKPKSSEPRKQKKTVSLIKIKPKPLKPSYNIVATADTLDWLKKLSGDSLQIVLVLNRVDKQHLLNQDSLVIPSFFAANSDDYCPFPSKLDSLNTLHKIIYVSRFAQVYAVYENGERIKWGPTSTGKELTQTPKGLFSTNWKSKRNISSSNSSWILNWCFNISNADGVSFHEYDLPGYPGSHSCIRLYAQDAEWFYYWADQWILKENLSVQAFGTPVVIFGEYPYESPKPWRRLVENSDYLKITDEQLTNETASFLELIISRQNTRKYILEKKTALETKPAV